MESSRPFISSIRRRSRSSSGARRRRMPRLMPRAPVGGVGLPQIVALAIGHHLERQLVVVAQEDRPLAVVGDVRRLAHDVGDREAVLLRDRHVHARHQREVERHVAFVAVAEILLRVLRPLVGLGEQHAVRVAWRRARRGSASGWRASPAGSRCWCPRARPDRAWRRAAARRRPMSSQKRMTSSTSSQHARDCRS